MKLDPVLTKAARLARKKDYNESIKTLESEAHRYYVSFTYYYLLGASYLHSKIFGVALTYLKLAREQKMRDPHTLLSLAALYLNHGDTDKAVDLYLEVQSIDESNRTAKKALKIIRKHPSPEDISAWIDSGRLHTLFPPFPRAGINWSRLVPGIIAGVAVLTIAAGLAVKAGLLSPLDREPRVSSAELSLAREERDAPVQTGGSYRYVLTGKQVLDEYYEAQKLFAQYRDEAAKVKLNRILESNASEPVKNRARLLISYMNVPGFDTPFRNEDRFAYNQVISDSFIYRDCHVIWRGMASNLDVGQNHTSFDFLVGYDTYRTMEGIVQVDYDFAIPVNTERPVEILGRIIPVTADMIRIQGVALNQAGLLDRNSSR
jgi:tetratricopeptide (TPR) repeat protein